MRSYVTMRLKYMFIRKLNNDPFRKLDKLTTDYPIEAVPTYDQHGCEHRPFKSFIDEFVQSKNRRSNGKVDITELLSDYIGLDRNPLKVKFIVQKYQITRQHVNQTYHQFVNFISSANGLIPHEVWTEVFSNTAK